jgi:methyl-accepting chemotaxis protein
MILTCFIVILSIGNIIIILFFWKSIVFPIRKLQNGAEQIGEGNLDYKINIKSNDEIGQLSTSFDQMAQKVKERTTKLDASLQQLKASNQQLLASNQQLDAATQQLRAANQQLVAVENGLREKIRELEVFNKATVGRELKMAELKKQITNLQK